MWVAVNGEESSSSSCASATNWEGDVLKGESGAVNLGDQAHKKECTIYYSFYYLFFTLRRVYPKLGGFHQQPISGLR